MGKNQFFQASIVDELAHLMEKPFSTSITQGWTFTLDGEVSSPAIRESLKRCLELYPKLRCTLTRDYPSLKRLFRYCWKYRDISSADIFQEIEDSDPNHSSKDTLSYYGDYHASHRIDITREPPIKILLIRQPERSHLIFFVHHAGVDGIGFLIFFQSFVEFYEDSFYQRKKNPAGLPDFGGISRPTIPCQLKHFLPQYLSLYNRYGVLKNRERLAYQDGEGGGTPMGKLLAIDRELPPEQFNALRATAKEHEVTINDYLLASMFHTVTRWNRQRNEQPGRIYLNVPVNLRSPEDRTIGNIMSGFMVSLPSQLIDDKEETIRAVKDRRSLMMKNNIAPKMAEIAWILKPLPLPLKNILYSYHPEIYFPTLTMSNIGICNPNPSHQDEDGFHYLGEARIGTLCFIGYAAPWPQLIALTYNNRMTISLSVFRSQFSLEAARAFLDSFIREITGEQ